MHRPAVVAFRLLLD